MQQSEMNNGNQQGYESYGDRTRYRGDRNDRRDGSRGFRRNNDFPPLGAQPARFQDGQQTRFQESATTPSEDFRGNRGGYQQRDPFYSTNQILRQMSRSMRFSGRGGEPQFEEFDTEKYHNISVDFPGVPRDNLRVRMENGYLNISGKRERNRETENGTERDFSIIRRTFYCGNVSPSDVTARYEDGVLTVSYPLEQMDMSGDITIT